MSPDPDRNTDKTEDAAPDETSEEDDPVEETVETSFTRRTALLGAGVGLGLLNGRRQNLPGRGSRRWNQDVDANANNLLNLGGLNMAGMDEEAFITGFDGPNLEIDDAILRVTDPLGVERIETNELAGGLTGGKRINDLAGDNLGIDGNRLNAVTHWSRKDVLLKPSEDTVDGIEVEDVESPEEENLRVESDADLVLSISQGQGAVRIETGGGHEIVLDDEDGSESISVEDNAGNSIELDSTTGEVSISANEKISFDAPEIDLSADETVNIQGEGSVNVESGGVTSLMSSGIMAIDGSIINLNGGAFPAARVGDAVNNGVIQTGSTTVFIG